MLYHTRFEICAAALPQYVQKGKVVALTSSAGYLTAKCSYRSWKSWKVLQDWKFLEYGKRSWKFVNSSDKVFLKYIEKQPERKKLSAT